MNETIAAALLLRPSARADGDSDGDDEADGDSDGDGEAGLVHPRQLSYTRLRFDVSDVLTPLLVDHATADTSHESSVRITASVVVPSGVQARHPAARHPAARHPAARHPGLCSIYCALDPRTSLAPEPPPGPRDPSYG